MGHPSGESGPHPATIQQLASRFEQQTELEKNERT